MDRVEGLPSESPGIVAMLILLAGLGAMAAGYEYFWVVFAAGYGGLLPLVAMLSADEDDAAESEGDEQPPSDEIGETTRTDALDTLRERYARGELTHEEFERKLEALLETDSPEHATDHLERRREREET